jgi:hypothetical protein
MAAAPSVPSGDDRTWQVKIWIWEAEQARHKLATGAHVAEVTHGSSGHSVKYSRGQLAELDRYIRQLRNEITNSSAATVSQVRVSSSKGFE